MSHVDIESFREEVLPQSELVDQLIDYERLAKMSDERNNIKIDTCVEKACDEMITEIEPFWDICGVPPDSPLALDMILRTVRMLLRSVLVDFAFCREVEEHRMAVELVEVNLGHVYRALRSIDARRFIAAPTAVQGEDS
jgi:hypothetical protein